jgi:hypothetical protein
MIRRIVVAAGTLSLIACAPQGADRSMGAASDLNGASPEVPVTVIARDHRVAGGGHSDADLVAVVRSELDLTGYGEAKVEDVVSADGTERLLVQLRVEGKHALKLARIDVDGSLNVQKVTQNYARSAEEQVDGAGPHTYACPDPSVQFIAFCPNDDSLELSVTNDVATAAEAAGLKTVRLLKQTATHDAYLNYMACPKLVGNFYDGDSNPDEMVVYNGALTAREIAASVKFNLQTTNIWLACEAYNDPMLTAVQTTAKSQKYAAGINDLAVGPSDRAAACAMKAAIAGKPMTSAFQACYEQMNESSDHWGFGGAGSDTFGVAP